MNPFRVEMPMFNSTPLTDKPTAGLHFERVSQKPTSKAKGNTARNVTYGKIAIAK